MQADLYHISIYIYNTEETVRFYKRLFDAEVLFSKTTRDGSKLTMLKMGDFELEVIEPDTEAERIRLTELNRMTPNHFCINVEDVEIALNNLDILGGDMEDGIAEIEMPPGTKAQIAFIHGPSGERIELYRKVSEFSEN